MSARKKSRKKETSLQADVFAINVPVDIDGPGKTPRTWKKVWEQVHASLRSLVANGFGLASDVLVSLRQLVRLLPALVPAVVKRIARAHEAADKAEAKKQEQVVQDAVTPLPEAQVVENLESALLALRAKGIAVFIVEHEGVPTVVVVRPELADSAVRIAQEPLSPEPSSFTAVADLHVGAALFGFVVEGKGAVDEAAPPASSETTPPVV